MAQVLNFGRRLVLAADLIGIQLEEAKKAKLLTYLDYLQRWNRTYNLTALRDPEQMLVQHLFDSMVVVPRLSKLLDKNTVSKMNVLDVGSGAGLPGSIIAILRDSWQVHCVDAVEKKAAFTRQISGALQLTNLHAVHGRIEALQPYGADIVISRAFASLVDFATLAGPHVASSGHLVAMKGREPLEEIEALEQSTGWRVDQIEPLSVPELNAQRCLVWMSRQGTI